MSPSVVSFVIPAVFVFLWATGFVVARFVVPYVDPMTFLTARFVIAAAMLAGVAVIARAPWPITARAWRDVLIAGLLMQGVYLGGVFWAVAHGLPAGVSALIAATQPLLTALLAKPLLGETVSRGRWIGVAIGSAGVALVLMPRLGGRDAYPAAALAASAISVLGITFGTIWQKRTGAAGDLRTGTAIQFGGSALLAFAVALLTESGRFESRLEVWLGFAWSIFGLSIGAVGLLLVMIRRSAVVGVASLLFLVPPVAALLGYVFFRETLTAVQFVGVAVATLGVALASRG